MDALPIADIVSNARLTEDNYLKRCSRCGILNHHRRKQNWLILPQVLIITLQRDEVSRLVEVNPSLRLKIEGITYELKAVIQHHGKCASWGHITSHLYNKRNDSWIECDDETVKAPTHQGPKDGFAFIYDKLEENEDILVLPTGSGNHQSEERTYSNTETMTLSNQYGKQEKSEDSEDLEDEDKPIKKSQKSQETSSDRVQCKICKKVVKYILSHLSSKKTKEIAKLNTVKMKSNI